MTLPADWSIRRKLNFILASTTFFALLVAGIALVLFDLRSQLHAIEGDLVTQADVMALVSGPALTFDDAKVARENLSVLRAKPNVVSAALYGARGQLFATFQPAAVQGEPIPARPQTASVGIDHEWVRVWRPVIAANERIGTVYLQARHNLLGRTLEYLGVLTLILGGSLAAALLLSNRLQGAVVAPILAIRDAARRVQQGPDTDVRAPKAGQDEIGDLADVFNAMLDELGLRARTLEQANRALRDSEQRYQLAVRGSSAGLWDWDMAADTMFYSPRFKKLLGYSDAEFPDAPSSLTAIMHEEDAAKVQQVLRDHLALDAPYQAEVRLRLKSGEWRWFMIAGMAQKNAEGRAFRMAGSVIDVTERKRAEQVLQDANRAKDEFIATLAHELRNPLAPIRTGLEILKKDKANGVASQKARETMERQLAHMIRLIDDLLDISRINSGKIRLEVTRIRLASAIESAVDISRPLMQARGHRLEVQLPAQDIELMADGTRLAQALGNLLNNAAKYTAAGGIVRVDVRQEGATAVIEVSDNGVGIPPGMLDEVFGLFTQVDRTLDHAQGGLGIGLYLVRSLVELHGGSVTASSGGTGHGSTFTIRVPCLLPSPAAATPGASRPADAPAGAGTKVLVVDDNVDAAETLAIVLGMTGRVARTVHEGQLVLQAAREFDPDIILLDIGLPGMSGYDVARQLRADPRFGRTLLIAITGWGSFEDRRRSSDAGFDEHLTKPVDLGVLEPLLNRQTGRSPRSGSAA
jgi:PAS domain S-box-containing protein